MTDSASAHRLGSVRRLLPWIRDAVKLLGRLLAFVARGAARVRPTRYGVFILFLLFFCVIYGFAFALMAPYIVMPFTAPLAILLLLIVWVLPDARAPTRVMSCLFFAFFISLVVWPNYLAVELPGLPWITVLRLTTFPLCIALMVSLSVSHEFRSRLLEIINAVPLIWKLLLIFVVIQFLSIGLSSQTGLSIDKFIVAQTSWTAIFFVSCYVFLTPKRPVLWAALLWAMAVFVGFIGIWESRIGRVPWVGHIPGFLVIEDPTVLIALAGASRSATGVHRVQSTFGGSLGLAEYIALTMPFVFHFTTRTYRLPVRIAALATVPFLFYVVILTDARLGIVGCLLTALGYIFMTSLMQWQRRRDSMFSLAILLGYPALFVGSIAATFFVGRVRNLVWGDGPQQASTDARVTQYTMGIPKVLHNPFGYGIGRGAQTLGFYQPDGLLTIDTYYLMVALEYGVIGFLLYYGMLLFAIWHAGRFVIQSRLGSGDYGLFLPITLALTNFFVIKSIFSQQDSHPLIYMLLGMLVALTYRWQKEHKDSAASRIGKTR